MDRLWVYTSVRDEEAMLPYFLRHYATIANKIVVQDCGSRDRTLEIARAHPKVEYVDSGEWPMDETRRKKDSHQFVHEAAGKCDWCICVDVDEFVVGNFERALREGEAANCAVLHTKGYTIVQELPPDDGRQIYEQIWRGTKGGAEKPCIVRAGADFEWSAGRHYIESPWTRVAYPMLTLLHFRYLGVEYTRARNARNYERSPDKLTAWVVAPEYKGDESADGVARYIGNAYDVRPFLNDEYLLSGSAFAPHLEAQMIKP